MIFQNIRDEIYFFQLIKMTNIFIFEIMNIFYVEKITIFDIK